LLKSQYGKVRDLRSPRAEVRAEAVAWWGNTAAVAFWSDLLDVDSDALRQAVQG
jgi:hypothetical protein